MKFDCHNLKNATFVLHLTHPPLREQRAAAVSCLGITEWSNLQYWVPSKGGNRNHFCRPLYGPAGHRTHNLPVSTIRPLSWGYDHSYNVSPNSCLSHFLEVETMSLLPGEREVPDKDSTFYQLLIGSHKVILHINVTYGVSKQRRGWNWSTE